MATSFSCAPSLLSRTTSTTIMSSLSSVSSTLPASILPWLKPSKSRSPYSPSPQISLPSIAAAFDRQPPISGLHNGLAYAISDSQSYESDSASQWRDSNLDASYSSDAFDSYESSPAAGPSSQSSPITSMDGEEPVANPPSVASSQWFWVGPQPSSQAIAEKTCEMVCYLWFSNTLGASKSSSLPRPSRRVRPGHSPHEPIAGLSDSSTAALQFTPSTQFVHFMQKLLQTTQVSQSVIVLALHYIYRLKEENHFTNGQAGSEFRVAVVALMLANKFVDDNTYTNKTWSDVSGIELTEINKMEREFLRGVDFRLYINTDTYKAWVNLLKGLVAAKERDEQQWHYSKRHNSAANIHAPVPRMSVPNLTIRQHPRARSSSPLPSLKASYPFTFNVPPTFSNPFVEPESPHIDLAIQPGAKRSAVDAFSPPSAALAGPPSKRPISLDMTSVRNTEGPASAGASYPINAFSRLSLNKPDTPSRTSPGKPHRHVDASQTLAAPYNVQDRVAGPDPQHLYYYALASSPTHTEEEDTRVRKALLRSHQPTYYPPPANYLQAPPQPMYIQSANASPVHPLPSYRYPQPHPSQFDQHTYSNTNANYGSTLALPPIRVQTEAGGLAPQLHYAPPQTQMGHQMSRVPVAPFANAGPPGVHWTSQQPPYSHAYMHARYALPQA